MMRRCGFTLIEMLCVLAITGILFVISAAAGIGLTVLEQIF